MCKRFVTWRPVKNTQKTAIQKFGNEWQIVRVSNDRILIEPLNEEIKDQGRWIEENQVLSRRWETPILNTTERG